MEKRREIPQTSTSQHASRGKKKGKEIPNSHKKRSSNTTELDERSEYEHILNSLINIKQGKAEAYSELVEKAMLATDNIMQLKQSRLDTMETGNENPTEMLGEVQRKFEFKSINKEKDSDYNDTQHNIGDNAFNNECEARENAISMLACLQSHIRAGETIDKETIEKVMREIEPNIKSEQKVKDQNKQSKKDQNHGKEDNEIKKKKLISGKCTKPNESDIQRVVKFAHEKLDARHTTASERVFDKLSFSLLIAGELEIASSANLDPQERIARINIAKTICYHKAYLKDAALRDGYDQLLKKIEQGTADWTQDLGEELHSYFDYQANKITREKIQNDAKFETVTPKYTKPAASNTMRIDKSETDRIIFCSMYNKGSCIHDDHHEGRFSNKSVTKWHICSKCLKNGDRRSHREIDEICPSN